MGMNREDNRDNSCCPPWSQMVAYFLGNLQEADASAIDLHFMDCDRCVDTAREAHHLALALQSWSPQAHGDAWRHHLLVNSVQQAAASSSGPAAARLHACLHQLRHGATGALRVLSDLSGVSLLTAGLSGLLAQNAWSFEPALAVRGDSKAPVLDALAEKAGWRVELSPDGQLVLSCKSWPAGRPLPLVLLIPESGAAPAVAIPLEQLPDLRLSGSVPAPAESSLLVFFDENPDPAP